jgi:hypothetical protein
MKNSIKGTMCKFGLILFLMMFSISGKAQSYTMSMTATAPTDRTIDVTLTITANTNQRFGGFSTGINYNTAIVNGGTITAAFVPGSKAAALSALNSATVNSVTAGQIRLPIQSLTGANGVDMAAGTSLVLGTYRITNTVAFATGSNASLWLQNVLATGRTNSLVNGYPFGSTTPATSYTTTAPSAGSLALGYRSDSTLSLVLNLPTCPTAVAASNLVAESPCAGAANGSALITLTGAPNNSAAITYKVDGGADQNATLSGGAFTVTGLSAGSHTVTVTYPTCSALTTSSFTIGAGAALVTPTVSLTSSDGDNTFAYGTSVTFTATAGNLGGGTASYDFKVNGSSVQNGASSSFVSSNLGNGNQVSVSITVSGGTCMSSTTANSTVITNTVTGAYLSNIICVPSLPVINRIIRATVPSGVSGVLGYRFKVRNNSTNTTVTLDRNVANFNLTMTSIYTYDTSFDVQVAAVVDGVEQPYSAVCVVTTPSIPLNQVGVGGVQCGGTLETLNTRIFANTVFGSQLYRFRVALSTAPTTYYYTTSVFPSFRLTGVAGLPLTYGTSYLVSVQSEVDVNGTLTISAYSTECTVSTPAVTAIVPSSAGQCGQTLSLINDRIFINSVPNANQYTYRLALASAPTVYYNFTSSFTNFRLTSVPGLPLTFETDYLLSVQARVTIEGQDYFSSFSTPCPVRTPNFPTVGLQASQCSNDNEVTPGPYQVTSNSEIIYSELVSGASYEFVLQKVINGVPTSDAPLTLVRPVNNFTLNMIEGVTPDTSYLVFVKLNYYGQGPEGKDCSIQSPSIVASPITKITQAFAAKAYPNPFANNFLLDLTTESQSPVSIKVYDMVGRLVDSRESKASNLNSLAIGDQYPSGVYNVVVTQDEEVRTLRVVKR